LTARLPVRPPRHTVPPTDTGARRGRSRGQIVVVAAA